MKKLFWALVVLCVAVCLASYIFIPRQIQFSKIESLAINSEEAFHFFKDNSLRKKWMFRQGTSVGSTNDNLIIFEDDSFFLSNIHDQSLEILVSDGKGRLKSQLLMVSKGVDSTVAIWESQIDAGMNPFKRIAGYFRARKIKSDFTAILASYKSFVAKPENIYSFPIVTAQVKDTLLITIRRIYPTRPTTPQIYSMVSLLEKYAQENKAEAANAPMLNITISDSSHYQCTVAIPLNKALPNSGEIYFSRMIPGRILIETVKGGPATIEYAFGRLSDYYRQHKLTSPALSFQSLITDRLHETDTSKWITKIYYPIF